MVLFVSSGCEVAALDALCLLSLILLIFLILKGCFLLTGKSLSFKKSFTFSSFLCFSSSTDIFSPLAFPYRFRIFGGGGKGSITPSLPSPHSLGTSPCTRHTNVWYNLSLSTMCFSRFQLPKCVCVCVCVNLYLYSISLCLYVAMSVYLC